MYSKKRKRTKKVISLLATVAMISVTIEPAAASVYSDSTPVIEQPYEVTESENPSVWTADEMVSMPAVTAAEPASGPAIDVTVPGDQPDPGEINADQLPDNSSAAEKTGELSSSEVYAKMNALRETYYEGMRWTNFEPYGSKGTKGDSYIWKGGTILGNVRSGVGCAAFAFELSDAAFGNLPARVPEGKVKFENVRPGDILRINGNSHSVIVLKKTAVGVIIAEANYNKSVHWDRALSKAEVEAADFIVTRYPADYNPEGGDIVDPIVETGDVGNNLKWTLTEGGILTISGNGDMQNFSSTDRPTWPDDRISAVVIENGVTSIGDYAFYSSGILSVSMPGSPELNGSAGSAGSLRTIGKNAFYNCKNLLSATIPKGVETIGNSAFSGCARLQYIDFPSSIKSVGAAAFMQCDEVLSVRFAPGSENVQIGDDIFRNCKKIQTVILPEKTDCIGGGVFANCERITSLNLPAGITFKIKEDIIVGSPFSGCTGLKEINFAGTQAQWTEAGGVLALNYMGGTTKPTVNFNKAFPNPFEKDPDDPGDLMGDHVHKWSSAEWNHDTNYHWHECTVQGCTVTANNEKDSYAQHSYGSWVVDTNATSYQSGSKHRDCTVCSYRQTNSIPATGGSSSGSSGGSWGSGGYWGTGNTGTSTGSSGKPEVTDKPDEPTGNDSTDSNTTDSSTSDTDGSSKPDSENEADNTDTSSVDQKQVKTKFKKQLKSDLKQQIKSQLKIKLKKQLKAEKKTQSKAKLKKQLKTQLKPLVKAKLKKQLKKQFGKPLGKEFTGLFNEQFNAQFNKVYNEQFLVQYKQYKQKKIK